MNDITREMALDWCRSLGDPEGAISVASATAIAMALIANRDDLKKLDASEERMIREALQFGFELGMFSAFKAAFKIDESQLEGVAERMKERKVVTT